MESKETYSRAEAARELGISKSYLSHIVNGYTHEGRDGVVREYPPKLEEGLHYRRVPGRASYRIEIFPEGIEYIRGFLRSAAA